MKDNLKSFFFLLAIVAVGSFAALIVWTLIVKTQITQTLATAQQSDPLLSALTGL